MMKRTRHAEIAGAGFAGLACAIALRQRGWTVRVHEAAHALRAFGAGIFIWQNALYVLDALDAYAAVRRGAFASPAFETRTNGEPLSWQAINSGDHLRVLTMTRQHLYQALLDSARRHGTEVVTGSRAIGAMEDGVLCLADGSTLPADLVIGADGVKSAVRDSLSIPMEHSQQRDGLIRVLTGRGPLRGGAFDNVIDFWRTGERTMRILYTPCGQDTLYMAMMAEASDERASRLPVDPQVWSEAFPELACVLQQIGDRGRYDLYETTKLRSWSTGRVAIVGDSAHGMPPTLGQGAGCAMTNALGLAVALEASETIEAGLACWEQQQRPLTDHTQARATELARSRDLSAGMRWDDSGLRMAWHVPVGARAGFTPL